jgi:hypothetical protein
MHSHTSMYSPTSGIYLPIFYIPHPFLEFRSNFASAPEERGG